MDKQIGCKITKKKGHHGKGRRKEMIFFQQEGGSGESGEDFAGVGGVGIEGVEQSFAGADIAEGEGGAHEGVERCHKLIRVVGDGAELSEGSAGDHVGIDETVAACIEGVEQLELESGGLVGDEDVDLSAGDKGLHGTVVGIGDEGDVAEMGDVLPEAAVGVASCDDKPVGGEVEDVVEEEADGHDVFGDGEVGMVEGVVAESGLRDDIVVGVGRGHEDYVGAAYGAEMGGVGLGDGEEGVGEGEYGLVATELACIGAEVETA